MRLERADRDEVGTGEPERGDAERARRTGSRARSARPVLTTRIRSPKSSWSASRLARACVETTTASACLRARFSIARRQLDSAVDSDSGWRERQGVVHGDDDLVAGLAVVLAQRREQARRVDDAAARRGGEAHLPGGRELTSGEGRAVEVGEPGQCGLDVLVVRGGRGRHDAGDFAVRWRRRDERARQVPRVPADRPGDREPTSWSTTTRSRVVMSGWLPVGPLKSIPRRRACGAACGVLHPSPCAPSGQLPAAV